MPPRIIFLKRDESVPTGGRRPFGGQKETTMRQVTLTVFALLLISAAANAATTERRHARVKNPATVERAAGWAKWQNSNAYIAPAYTVPNNTSELSEGAMTSGIAGH
jgi:hypothetical protein